MSTEMQVPSLDHPQHVLAAAGIETCGGWGSSTSEDHRPTLARLRRLPHAGGEAADRPVLVLVQLDDPARPMLAGGRREPGRPPISPNVASHVSRGLVQRQELAPPARRPRPHADGSAATQMPTTSTDRRWGGRDRGGPGTASFSGPSALTTPTRPRARRHGVQRYAVSLRHIVESQERGDPATRAVLVRWCQPS